MEPWFAVIMTCISILCMIFMVFLCVCAEHQTKKTALNFCGLPEHGTATSCTALKKVQCMSNCTHDAVLANQKKDHVVDIDNKHHVYANGPEPAQQNLDYCHNLVKLASSVNDNTVTANDLGHKKTVSNGSATATLFRYETQHSKCSVKSSQEGRELPPVPGNDSLMPAANNHFHADSPTANHCVSPTTSTCALLNETFCSVTTNHSSSSDPYQNASADSLPSKTAPLFVNTTTVAVSCAVLPLANSSVCTLDSDLNSDADPLYSRISHKRNACSTVSPGSCLGSPHSSAQSTPSRDHYSRMRVQPMDSSQVLQLRRLHNSGSSESPFDKFAASYVAACNSKKCDTSSTMAEPAAAQLQLLNNNVYSTVRRGGSGGAHHLDDNTSHYQSTEDEDDEEALISHPQARGGVSSFLHEGSSLSASYASIPPLPVRGYGQSEVDLLESLRLRQVPDNSTLVVAVATSTNHLHTQPARAPSLSVTLLPEESTLREQLNEPPYHRVSVRESLASLRARNALPSGVSSCNNAQAQHLQQPSGVTNHHQTASEDVYEGIDDISNSTTSEIRPYAVDSCSDLYSEFVVDGWTLKCPADSLSEMSLISNETQPTQAEHLRLRSTIDSVEHRSDPIRRASYHGAASGEDTASSCTNYELATSAKKVTPQLIAEMRSFRHMDSDVDISEHTTPNMHRRLLLNHALNNQKALNDEQAKKKLSIDAASVVNNSATLHVEHTQPSQQKEQSNMLIPRRSVMTPLMERSIEGSLFEMDNCSDYERLPTFHYQRAFYTTQTSCSSSSNADSPVDILTNSGSPLSLDAHSIACTSQIRSASTSEFQPINRYPVASASLNNCLACSRSNSYSDPYSQVHSETCAAIYGGNSIGDQPSAIVRTRPSLMNAAFSMSGRTCTRSESSAI